MNDQGDIMSGLGASGKLYIYPPLRFIPDGKSRNIQLMEKPFKFSTPEVARQVGELLYNVMIKQYNNDSFAYQIEHNGRMVDTPFTPAMLSKFMVNNGQKTILSKEDAESFPFLVSKQLFVDTKNGQVYYGNSKHSLVEMQTNPNLKEDFIKHIIENQHWAMDKDWLYKNMRETVLTSAINYFNTTGAEKLSIIPGELEFDKDDFGLIQGEYDLREDPNNKGLSWIGWYAKNGKLLSDLDDKLFKSPMHYIEDVTLDNKQTGTDPSNNPHVTLS